MNKNFAHRPEMYGRRVGVCSGQISQWAIIAMGKYRVSICRVSICHFEQMS